MWGANLAMCQRSASTSAVFAEATALRDDGDYTAARPLFWEALLGYQESGKMDSAAYAAYRVFDCYFWVQEIDAAHEFRVDTLDALFAGEQPYFKGIRHFTAAREYSLIGAYAESIVNLEIAHQSFNECCTDSHLLSDICGTLASLLVHFERGDEAIEYAKEAVDLAQRTGDLHQLGISLHNKALAHSVLGQYHESVASWEQAYATLLEALGPNHATTIQVAMTMADGYDGIGRLDRAMHYLRIGLRADTVLSAMARSGLYRTYGELLTRLHLEDQALYWQRKSTELLADILPPNHPQLLESKLALADLHLWMKNAPASLALIQEVEDVHNSDADVADNPMATYQLSQMLAKYNIDFGDPQAAVDFAHESLEIVMQFQPGDSPPHAEMLNLLGLAYTKMGAYDRAIEYLALEEEMTDRMGERHVNGVLYAADSRCEALLGAGRNREALATFRDAAQFVAGTQTLGAEGPEPLMLAKMLRLLATQAPNALQDQDYLLVASALTRAIERGRFLVDALVRKEVLMADLSFALRGATVAAARQCASGSSDEVCAQGIRFLDLSKALSLQQRAAAALADVAVGLPDSIIRRSQQLEQDLLAWRVVDASEVRRQHVLDSLQRAWTQHEDVLRRNYPGHYESTHSALVDLDALQNIARARKLTFISFMIDTSAQVLVRAQLDERGYSLTTLPFDEASLDRIDQFRDRLHRTSKVGIASLAYAVYGDLFHGLSLGDGSKQVVISTDENLSGIPFGALLTELPSSEQVPMREWAWLKNDLTIAYADAWQNIGFQTKSRGLGQQLAVLAPGFEPSSARTVAGGRGTDADLLRTPWTIRLVDWLKTKFGAAVYTAEAATERSLLERALQADILHLGTHAFLNEQEPLLSYFALTAESAAAEEDGRLHAYELYPARVKAQLAVLPTCHSGTGTYTVQHGTLSLATAMRAAGCPTVVQSFWAIDDERTNELMQMFYEELLDNKRPVAEALSTAQTRYLEGAAEELQHPYYWAGLAVVGPSQQVLPKGEKTWILLLGCIALLVGFGLYWSRQRKHRSNNAEVA